MRTTFSLNFCLALSKVGFGNFGKPLAIVQGRQANTSHNPRGGRCVRVRRRSPVAEQCGVVRWQFAPRFSPNVAEELPDSCFSIHQGSLAAASARACWPIAHDGGGLAEGDESDVLFVHGATKLPELPSEEWKPRATNSQRATGPTDRRAF
jgi:hypothetical protein